MSEFYVHIENEIILNPATVRKGFKLKDGWHKVRIENTNKRSNKQNRFYWLLLTDYIQPGLYEIGYRKIKTPEDAHSFCTNEFLKKQVINEETGDVKTHVQSTTKLTTAEWEAYREDLNQFAAEYLGIVLPDPNEQLKLELS